MHPRTPRTSPTKIKNIPAYFAPGEKGDAKQQKAREAAKMAEAGKVLGGENQSATKADVRALSGRLDNLEQGLLSKISELLQPLSAKLEQLTVSIQNVAGVAEAAMELSLTHKDDLKQLQENETKHSEQLAILGNRQRFFNLKFRGIKELAESEVDLNIYMASWLASALNLGGECAPLLTQSYRLGKVNSPARTLPRDIICTFADIRTKNRIIDEAKKKGFLLHRQEQVLVFQDLTPETLQKRKELKGIISALRGANIRHRWVSPLKLQVSHKGKSFFIQSEDEGHDILAFLNIETPMSTEKASSKRRLNCPGSPSHQNKKSNTEALR